LKIYGIIANNIIVNTAVWDGSTNWNPDGEVIDISELPNGVGVGWIRVKNEWFAPQVDKATHQELLNDVQPNNDIHQDLVKEGK